MNRDRTRSLKHNCNNTLRPVLTRFSDKDDLVEACMAAVHVPFFLDWRFSAPFRGGPFMDGSVRRTAGRL